MGFNKRIAALAVAAAVAGGGAAFLLVPEIVSAQESQPDTQSEAPTDSFPEAPQMPEGSAPEGMPPGGPPSSESGSSCAPGGPSGSTGEEGPRGPNLELAAEVIGVDVEDLTAALQDGQTVAEVAEANDVDPDEVVAALVDDAEEHLAEAVDAGELTEEEADEISAELPQRIAEFVENGPPAGGPQGAPQGVPQGGPTGPSGGYEDENAPQDTQSSAFSL
jgi:hypothetical protein